MQFSAISFVEKFAEAVITMSAAAIFKARKVEDEAAAGRHSG